MEKNMNAFNRNLHNLLAISGTDAAELAQALNVELPEMNRWLNGSAAPDVYQLQEIARRFGMPYSYFFESSQSLPNVPEVAAWLGLSEETVETLLAMADTEPEEVMDALDDAIYAMAAAVRAAGGGGYGMKKEEQKDLLIGEEIAIRQIGVPYGWLYRRTEPGYLLADGTALLECERDSAGRYKGGAGLDGVYLHTGRLYVPVLAEDGKVRAFQEVRPENYLAAAEMSAEGNYNQIDGIINNEPPPKPSVLDALSQCRQDAAKGHDTPKKPPARTGGGAMKLSGTERETIVLYNEAEAAASIYTHNAALCRQLSELCGTYPGQVRQTGDNGYGGLSFELPKKWVRITPPRVLTPAQRAVLDQMNEKRRGG